MHLKLFIERLYLLHNQERAAQEAHIMNYKILSLLLTFCLISTKLVSSELSFFYLSHELQQEFYPSMFTLTLNEIQGYPDVKTEPEGSIPAALRVSTKVRNRLAAQRSRHRKNKFYKIMFENMYPGEYVTISSMQRQLETYDYEEKTLSECDAIEIKEKRRKEKNRVRTSIKRRKIRAIEEFLKEIYDEQPLEIRNQLAQKMGFTPNQK